MAQEPIGPAEGEALRRLIEKWRKRSLADDGRTYNALAWRAVAFAVRACADELETAAGPIAVEMERLRRIAEACGREADRWATKYRELKTAALAPLSGPVDASREPLNDLLVEVYYLAKDLWAAQCYGFTGAPEHLKRGAHEAAREGFDAICKKLGPVVHPILAAEWKAAEALAAAAAVPSSPAREAEAFARGVFSRWLDRPALPPSSPVADSPTDEK